MADGAAEHPVARVLLPAAGAVGVVGYGALYLAALAFYAPFAAVPEDAGLTQSVLLVRLTLLLSLVVVLLLLVLVVVAVVVATLDGVRRLAGRPRVALDRRPGPRTLTVAAALLAGLLASPPWVADGDVAAAVLVTVLVLAATWLARRVVGGVRAPAAVLVLAVWAGAAVGLVNLGRTQAEQVLDTGTWDDDVELLGVYPGYAYLGQEYGPAGGAGRDDPYVALGDDGGVFVLLSCRDARSVRVSTTVVSVTLTATDADTDTARDRCAALRDAAGS